MKKKCKVGILIIIIFVMIVSLTISNPKASIKQESSIKIGALGPLAITPGKDMEAGAELAVKEINDAGGIDVGGTAYTVELVVETTSSSSTGLPDTTTAVTGVRKLIDSDDVTAILGGFRTEMTLGVMAELDRPFLGVGSTAPIVTPYFWRTGPSNGTILAHSLIDLYLYGMSTLGVKNVTVVREDAAWTLAMAPPIKGALTYVTKTQNFTADIVIAEGATLDAVTASLSTIGDDVDAIMTMFSGPAGKHITQAWTSLNLTQFLAGINVEAQASTFFDETEGAAYGEIAIETLPPDVISTTKTAAFRAAYEAEYGEAPTYTAGATYDAVYVIKDAIERADSLVAADLQTALADTDYEGSAYNVKYTSEPGSQLGIAPNGTKVPIPWAPTGIIVHDLYTSSTIGVIDDTYIQLYFSQWQQGGVKKTLWGNEAVATRSLAADLEWPINHAEHGYTAPVTTETTTTTTMTTSDQTTTSTTTTTRSSPLWTSPSWTSIIVLMSITALIIYRRRKVH